jgi:dihydrodipicolinate reductase
VNPWLVIGAVALVGWGGFRLGVDHEKAAQADQDAVVQKAVEEFKDANAKAVAGIRPRYTTIQNEVQREIKTNTVFVDCKLPADSVRLVNQALSGGREGERSGGGELPQARGAD